MKPPNLPSSPTPSAKGPLATAGTTGLSLPAPMAVPRPPLLALAKLALLLALSAACCIPSNLKRSSSRFFLNTSASVLTFFGLNLLAFFGGAPVLAFAFAVEEGGIVGGGRIGVEAGVSVGCVAGDEFGSISISSFKEC